MWWLQRVCWKALSGRGLQARVSCSLVPGYSKVRRIEKSDETVKKIFDLNFASQRESTKAVMAQTLQQFESRPGDTGNPAASSTGEELRKMASYNALSPTLVAALTVRIKYLTEHLKINRKDKSCLRSLLRLVHRRRKLLLYTKRKDFELYHIILKELGVRPPVLLKYAQKSRLKD